jgi:hypothetical protein
MTITVGEHDEAVARLRELLPPDSTVYLVLEHVSGSGMSRWIKCYANTGSDLWYISGYVEKVTGANRTRGRSGNFVGGCGMDMGFHLVSTLSYRLYGGDYELRYRWL